MDNTLRRKRWKNYLLGMEILLCFLQVAMAFGYGLGEKALGINGFWVPIPSYIGVPLFIVAQWYYTITYKDEKSSLSPLFPDLTKKQISWTFYLTAGGIVLGVILMLLANGQVLPDYDKTYVLLGFLIVYPGLISYAVMVTFPFFQGEGNIEMKALIYIAYEAIVIIGCGALCFFMVLNDNIGMSILFATAPLTFVLILGIDPNAKNEIEDEK